MGEIIMRKRSDILFLLPSLCGFLLFFIIPFIGIFYYAFTENAFTDKFIWFDNFISVLKNEYFRLAIINTLKFTAVSVSLLMVFSIITAMVITQFALKFPLISSAFFLPFLLPSASFIMFWHAYFNNIKPFNSLILFFIWKYAGLNIMIIITSLLTIPTETLEAASIDGAGAIRKTYNIILPMITPTLFFTLVISIINSFKIFKESYLLYGNYPDESVYMLQNYLNNHFTKLNYQNISTAAIFFAVFIYIIVSVLFFFERKIYERTW